MTNEVGVCDAFCKGCIFSSTINGNKSLMACDYYDKTGKLRPCKAGTGCTVKQTGTKKGLWREEYDETWKTRKKKEKQPKPEREVLHRVCPVCGTAFDTTDHKKIYCNSKCRDKHKAAVLAASRGPLPVLHRICPECGTEFDTTNKRKFFCCRVCGDKAKHRARSLQKQAQKAVEVYA